MAVTVGSRSKENKPGGAAPTSAFNFNNSSAVRTS